ncbi:hypothetical protein SCALM49S_00305 [Streptomyces californicus]
MLNTIAPETPADSDGYHDAFYADPVRRYMVPVRSDRDLRWPSHPLSSRDSLHEAEMWVVEGLTRRYPTKVLAELVATCPQYCGHCTRMDLVGGSTPSVDKQRLTLRPADRQEAILDHLRRTPGVRDVVVSGGDVANVPWPRLESFLLRLLEIDSVRDVGWPAEWSATGGARAFRRSRRAGAGRTRRCAPIPPRSPTAWCGVVWAIRSCLCRGCPSTSTTAGDSARASRTR